MDNEIQKNKPEEEYHFSPEVETPNVYGAEAAGTKQNAAVNFFDRVKRKNILIVAGIIIVVLSVYKLLDVIFTSPPTRASRPAPAFPAAPTTPTTTPAAAIVPPVVTTTTVTTTPATPSIESRLSAVEEKTNSMQDSLSNLNAQMGVIQGSLSAINTQLTSLSDSTQSLAAQVAQMQAAAITVRRAKVRSSARRHYIPRPIFFVRAMIPGRAWLITKQGETRTVSIGDYLPGYGRVMVIDPVRGLVTTNAGAIIGYSPNDR